ncbi:MAG: hypothetical protein IKS71_00935 [Bacteroidales bacterium]|nr:hypothetical protein [Bacteroidales bacterium]
MTVTFETLGAIYRIAKYFIFVDGELTEEEVKPIFDWFQTFPDIDKEKLDYIIDLGENKITDERAIELISKLEPDGKQQMSNLFAKIICADGELTEGEKNMFFKVQDLCGLPDPVSEGAQEEEAPEEPAEEEDDDDSIIPAFLVATCQGIVTVKQSENENWRELEDDLSSWIGANGIEIVRFTPALNQLSEDLRLNERHLVFMLDRNPGFKTRGDNMTASILYGRGYPIYGDIIFGLETDKGYEIEGVRSRSLLVEIFEKVNAAVNGLLRVQQ